MDSYGLHRVTIEFHFNSGSRPAIFIIIIHLPRKAKQHGVCQLVKVAHVHPSRITPGII